MSALGVVGQFVSISTSASGDTTLVSAVSGKRIVVVCYTVTVASSVSVTFKSGSTSITGAMALTVGASPPFCPIGLFATASGEALVISLSSAVATAGHLTYFTV